jgi:hypothetical protein
LTLAFVLKCVTSITSSRLIELYIQLMVHEKIQLLLQRNRYQVMVLRTKFSPSFTPYLDPPHPMNRLGRWTLQIEPLPIQIKDL